VFRAPKSRSEKALRIRFIDVVLRFAKLKAANRGGEISTLEIRKAYARDLMLIDGLA
jgi:hypothetical protein